MWPRIKKYAKYVGIALAGVGLVVLYVMVKSWLKPKPKDNGGLTEGTEKLKDVLNEIGDRYTEANQQATVEIVAARQEEATVKQELAAVVAIKDKNERRQRLADLYNKVATA